LGRALRAPRPPLPRFAVAWFPAFEGIERIEAYRQRHDPQAGTVAAHLTLVFPFPTALTALQVETHVRKVASGWPPIAVAFRPVRGLNNEFVLLMATRGAAAVTQLHDTLYTRSIRPHLRRDLPYEPHITIARQPEPARYEAALAQAEAEFHGEFGTVLREVTLLSVRADGKIDRLKDLPLDSR
jgi:2'-5' RNA ligase